MNANHRVLPEGAPGGQPPLPGPTRAARQSVSLLCATLEARRVDGDAVGEGDRGREVEVTLIRPGVSANGLRYRPAVLRAAAGLFEGAAAFADHPSLIDTSRQGGRSIRDLVGVFHAVRFDEGRGIVGRLRFLPAAAWARSLVEGVIADREAGRPAPNLGLSADLVVLKQLVYPAGASESRGARRTAWEVIKIEAVNSCDLVFRPAAGGSFDRLLEAAPAGADYSTIEEESMSLENTDQVTVAAPGEPPAAATPEVGAELQAVREARAQLCAEVLNARLAGAQLPPVAQRQLRERFQGRAFAAGELDAEIARVRELLGAAVAPSVVAGMGAPRAAVGLTSLEKVQLALERLFGLPLPDACADLPRLSGIREAYLLITGDHDFRGVYNWERSVAREANEVTTAVMDRVVANVLNKRLVADYEAQPKWWRPLVSVVDLRDMKTQTRVLLNDFAGFPTVNENAAYANMAWGDSAETYAPVKKGGLVYVTLEMIVNDDLRAVQRIPRKLAAAAAVTINEYLSGLFTANDGAGPAMTDTYNVFDAVNHQGNAGSAALAEASLQAGITALAKFTNSAGKRIGVRPRYLLIPPDLEFAAAVLVNSTLKPGSPNNDVNPLRGIVEPIVVPNWTDANNWYLVADPQAVEGIELGFLNGRQTPELMVQDNPTAGSVFSNDAISWKVRWIFGGGWLDYRAAYAGIVAG